MELSFEALWIELKFYFFPDETVEEDILRGASFEKAIDYIMVNEGGYANHKNDPGGPTNFGISLKYLVTLKDEDGDGFLDGDLDKDGDVDADDIRLMTREVAHQFYKRSFWDPNRYGEIFSQRVATKVLDMSVNMGSKTANKILQKSLEVVAVDGVIGRETIGVINSFPEQMILDRLVQNSLVFYSSLVAKDKKFAVFLNGWFNRARKLPEI